MSYNSTANIQKMLPIPVNMMLTQSVRKFGAGFLSAAARRDPLRNSVSTFEISDLERMLNSSHSGRQNYFSNKDAPGTQTTVVSQATKSVQHDYFKMANSQSIRKTQDIQSSIDSFDADCF